jgi:UDP-N-acetyl-D-glucosamine/UDP-N-acetyl-D-galactosamine dehydrogenase
LEAAGTKWNFVKFQPGLVGGHCIGVDPYYLTYKAQEMGYHAQVINSGRYVNDSMGFYLAKQTVKKMIAAGKDISKTKVLVMGATFKENVKDIRNSKAVDVVNELVSYGVQVEVIDPRADSKELKQEYGIELVTKVGKDYDAIIVAVNHDEYKNFDEKYFISLTNQNALIVDVKGIYKGKIKELNYWSL